ncbi:Calcium-activated SK potassium channel [Ancylostoma duodenale]|uniref:Calcium-activated SK potassium channel n=1 Tax=Ancylostoma duodenale TaxID=51022 RepID=A0A0C2FUN9_9BILA|nr:Calcium-activated SK potassium channel [Ancylostoma duodenale]
MSRHVDNNGVDEIMYVHPVSLMLRSFVALSTIALLTQIVLYHINDVVLDLVDCGADDWRVVVTTDRALQFCTEFVLCAICPLPGTGSLHWSFIETTRNMQASHGRSFYVKEDFPGPRTVDGSWIFGIDPTKTFLEYLNESSASFCNKG